MISKSWGLRTKRIGYSYKRNPYRGRGRADSIGHSATEGLQTKFFLNAECKIAPRYKLHYNRAMFYSLAYEPRKFEATEARLSAIYEAAKLGLKGDTLALAAGMLPQEYRQLCQLDQVAEMAALKGKADGEILASRQLHQAAADGDAKASLAILQHVHGWVAKQAISIDIDQRISITQALAEAERRVLTIIEDDAVHQIQR